MFKPKKTKPHIFFYGKDYSGFECIAEKIGDINNYHIITLRKIILYALTDKKKASYSILCSEKSFSNEIFSEKNESEKKYSHKTISFLLSEYLENHDKFDGFIYLNFFSTETVLSYIYKKR
jgi:hypothetical protein